MSAAPTLRDALRVLNDRKIAAGLDAPHGEVGDMDDYRGILAGSGVDPAELLEVGQFVGDEALRRMAEARRLAGPRFTGNDALALVAGLWVDGLLTGLALRDLEARHAAS